MSIFLGVGLGPIQTGIFLSGAYRGDFSRIVVAEVDQKIVDDVRRSSGVITVNVAASDRIYQEEISGLEVYNPLVVSDLGELIDIASCADEIATALPSVDFFPKVAEWLGKGLQKDMDRTRLIYTAENHNHAAELFCDALGNNYPNCHFLNTVVGKMSGVVTDKDCLAHSLAPLCYGADRGHLVEEFNKILISNAPGIEKRKVQGLFVKQDLYPFEEAKLYGHNAIHFLLGLLGKQAGETYMSDIRKHRELMDYARKAFIDESGRALCKKWSDVDELFTLDGFKAYADDLLLRMTNPFLNDPIDRITRDPKRKLGWDDRLIGTMRVVIAQDFEPVHLAKGAALAGRELFGPDKESLRNGFAELWPDPWEEEHEVLFSFIASSEL